MSLSTFFSITWKVSFGRNVHHPSKVCLFILCKVTKKEIDHLVSIGKQMEGEIYEYLINYNNEDRKKLVSYVTAMFPKLY